MAELKLYLDIAKTNALASGTDVTSKLQSVQFVRGLQSPIADLASPLQFQFTLFDPLRSYNPDTNSYTNALGAKADLFLRHSSTNYQIVTGWIHTINSSHDKYGYTTTFTCGGRLEALMAATFDKELDTSRAVSMEIEDVMKQVSLPYPYVSSAFILGIGILGTTSLLAVTPSGLHYSIEDDSTNLPILMPEKKSPVSAYLGGLIGSSRGGIFFEARDGKLTYTKASTINGAASTGTLDVGKAANIQSVQGIFVSKANIEYVPREYKLNALVHREPGMIPLAPASTTTIRIRYTDPDDEDVIDVVAITDPVPTWTTEGTVSVTYSKLNDREIEFYAVNNTVDDDNNAIQGAITSLEIRINGIFSKANELLELSSGTAVNKVNWLPPTTANAKYANTEAAAQSYGDDIFSYYSSSGVVYNSVTWTGSIDDIRPILHDGTDLRKIGECVRLSNDADGHDDFYIIMGEHFSISNGMCSLTWVLMARDRGA